MSLIIGLTHGYAMAKSVDLLSTEALTVPAQLRRRPAWRRSPLTMAGLVLIGILALIAMLAPLIAPADPLKQVLSTRLKPPAAAHWLGTDQLGREDRKSTRLNSSHVRISY